ncbi:DUF4065 domain-containing protein [Pseudoglutamicibacter albus]|uniref:Phage-associated protein n=1 Tax=Pseudoglutamicibacter albus TaxID=98671 RepID=A0ABU1YWY4_9MICC|nr:type II toxin-antitoxin system antitoxin SocA domain-containing protein [Pseudoglutamicibacter albus]MCG7303866.1 DUF4065 domain-containing protein [Pseudoglutamicibacter albus]MDR7292873.1 putative phage-associated protein [Pseudoglutamicibacter albus]
MDYLWQFISWTTRREADEALAPSITNMKAQKLAYLAESLYGHLESRDLSAGAFQAWEHGPAQPELYRAIKSRVGDNPAAPLPPFSGGNALSKDIEEIYEGVWDNFGGMTANQLRNFTHTYGPYDRHYRRDVRDIDIPKDEIHEAWPEFINGLHIFERSPEMRRRVVALAKLPRTVASSPMSGIHGEIVHDVLVGPCVES